MDRNFLVRPEISKIIREMRGGSWSAALIVNTICLAVICGIWLLGQGSEGFVQQPNPGWGLDRPNPFQPPSVQHRYPPLLEVLDPRRSSAADRGSALREGRLNVMCPAQPDKNGFVMSYDEAYQLVAETYSGYCFAIRRLRFAI